MSDSSRPTKADLRAEALARRNALSDVVRFMDSHAIAERARELIQTIRPEVVGTYRAFGTEVDTSELIAGGAPGAIALSTMVDRDTMVFKRYRTPDPLAADALGILAPAPAAEIMAPDLLIVPVTAFDRSGNRLGKGRGIYDRAIADFRGRGVDPALVGIAFSVQEVASIPSEPHDIRLDWIVTENQTLQFRRGPLKRD